MHVTNPLCLPIKLHGLMLAPRALFPFQGGGTGDVAPPPKCRTVVDFWEHHPENVKLFYFLYIFVGTVEKEEKNIKEEEKGNKEEDKEEKEEQ